MERLLQALRDFDALRDQQDRDKRDSIAVQEVPSEPPAYAPDAAFERIPADLREALRGTGITRLYEHQAEALELVAQGKNVVLEAPTASGKTLCFTIPMLQLLQQNPESHAMLIYPMKALSNDQRRQIHDIVDRLPNRHRRIESWTYDGDTEQEHRKVIRERPPAILITNPEMLHLSFLGAPDAWEGFLKKLRFLVVDEIHEYRGFFGTNVSMLLRRFLLKLNRMGTSPQLVLASATCANPLSHAEGLTGSEFSLVSARNRMRPRRHFAFIAPSIPDFRYRYIYELRIARAGLAALSLGLTTIVFCPSRRFAEDVFGTAVRGAERAGIDKSKIAPYRSGYTPDERRGVEEGLRNGLYQLVFSTNALELGMDIGRLDVCILAGFPDSVMSAWQRIGRVGRSWEKDTYVLFYAMNNAVDEFYAQNLDAFLQKPLDEIAIGVDNEELIERHVPYLLHEVGWRILDEDHRVIGRTFWELARTKAANAKPVEGHCGPNYMRLDIRGTSGGTYVLKYKGRDIGSLSEVQCFREAYVGAIYSHFGQKYKVIAHGTKEVFFGEAEAYLRTEPGLYWKVHVNDIIRGNRFEEVVSIYYGKITVYENFTGFRTVDIRSGSVVDEESAQRARPYIGHAFWLSIEDSGFAAEIDRSQGVRALEQLIRIGTTFVIPCDRHDTTTTSTLEDPQSVYLYENVPGGIGIAEKVFERWREILKAGKEVAERCACPKGCPRCIHPPRLRDAKGLEKKEGIALAQRLLDFTEMPRGEEFEPGVHGWVPVRNGNQLDC